MSFQTKTFQSVVASEINRARVSTPLVTDYNVGSVERTILESGAQELDLLYQRLLNRLLTAIDTSVYTSFNFPAIPAAYASGPVRVSMVVQSDAVLIAAGSIFTRPDGSAAYAATTDATVQAGASFADVPVQATVAGIGGNMPQLQALTLEPLVAGFISATNLVPFTNGVAAETPSAQKVRFDAYLTNLARGTGASIEEALERLATLMDASGNVTERVASVSIVEPYLDDPSKTVGLVQAYIHNGVGATSSALVNTAQNVVNGYIDTSGATVSGYKASGVRITVFAATEIPLAVVGALTINPNYDRSAVVAQVTAVLYTYVLGIATGEPYIGAVADDLVMQIPGVLNWEPLDTLAYVGVPPTAKLMPAHFQLLGWLAAATVVKTQTTGDLGIAPTSTDFGIATASSANSAGGILTATDHGAALSGIGLSANSSVLNSGGPTGLATSRNSATAALTTGIHLAGTASSADVGTGNSVPPPIPAAVTNLQQAAASPNPTTTSMKMSWGAPPTGNGLYTYSLSYSLYGSGTFSSPTTGIVGTSFTQTGLQKASLYFFRVLAVDSLGRTGPVSTTGAWSTAATDTPVTTESATGAQIAGPGPGVITNSIGETFGLVSQSNGPPTLQVNGSVDPTFSAGAFLIIYSNHTVFVFQSGSQWLAKVAAAEPWIVFTGPGGIPFVETGALTGVGSSSNSGILRSNLPAQVTGVSASAPGSGTTVTVNWSAVPQVGALVNSYIVLTSLSGIPGSFSQIGSTQDPTTTLTFTIPLPNP